MLLILIACLLSLAIGAILGYVVTAAEKDREWGLWLDAVNQSWNDSVNGR